MNELWEMKYSANINSNPINIKASLKMEVTGFSEQLVFTHEIDQFHNSEGHSLNFQYSENSDLVNWGP
jgi:hypothetical protein